MWFVCSGAAQEPSSEKPLPEMSTLWQAIKPHLMDQYDQAEILKGYTYRRDHVEEELDRNDAVRKTEHSEYQVFYVDQGAFSKLVRKDGVPISDKEAKKQDEEFEKFKRSGPEHRRSAKEREENLDDVYNGANLQVLRRELVAGRPTIVVSFTPRPDAKLAGRPSKYIVPNVEGTAWVDEQDFRLVRLNVRFLRSVKIGFGLLANIGEGGELTVLWSKVNNEVWLPAHVDGHLKGRVLVKGFNTHVVEDFSDYKKFVVETTIKVNE